MSNNTIMCCKCPLAKKHNKVGNGVTEPPYITVYNCPFDKDWFKRPDDTCDHNDQRKAASMTTISLEQINDILQSMVDNLNNTVNKKNTAINIDSDNKSVWMMMSKPLVEQITELEHYCEAYAKLGIKDESGRVVEEFTLTIDADALKYHIVTKYHDDAALTR